MNDYPWFLLTDQLPIPEELVEVKWEMTFEGTFQPDCKLSKWIMKDREPKEMTPVAWRCIKQDE